MCFGGGHGFLGFQSASTLVGYTYGNTVDHSATFVAGISASGFVEDDDDWSIDDIPLSRNADARESLRVDFMAIQTQCLDLTLSVPDKAGDVFRLRLWVLMHCSSWGRLECR